MDFDVHLVFVSNSTGVRVCHRAGQHVRLRRLAAAMSTEVVGGAGIGQAATRRGRRLGAVGLGIGGVQRRHPHLRLLGLSHRRGRRRPAGRHLGEHLVRLVAGHRRLLHRGAGAGDRAAGRRRRAPQAVAGRLDRADRRWRWLGLFFVQNDYHYLWLGLVLLGLGSIFFEFAAVSYNAMLHQVSTPANIGRVSGVRLVDGLFRRHRAAADLLRRVHRAGRRLVRGDLRGRPEHPDGGAVRGASGSRSSRSRCC